MKNALSMLLMVFICAFAYGQYYNTTTRPYEDVYGNNYSNFNNLFEDSDNDGLNGYFDNNDRSSNVFDSYKIETPKFSNSTWSTPSYSTPRYNSYPSYDFNSNRTIYTGPRGGQYYINSNGNKTYIKKDPW